MRRGSIDQTGYDVVDILVVDVDVFMNVVTADRYRWLPRFLRPKFSTFSYSIPDTAKWAKTFIRKFHSQFDHIRYVAVGGSDCQYKQKLLNEVFNIPVSLSPLFSDDDACAKWLDVTAPKVHLTIEGRKFMHRNSVVPDKSLVNTYG